MAADPEVLDSGARGRRGGETGSAARKALLAAVAAALAAVVCAAVFFPGTRDEDARPSFHDIRVVHIRDLTSIVDPSDPAVRSLAERLGTPEAAYMYVRDRIAYVPMLPAVAPGETLREGAASCLGKATLLCSLYRALGIPAAEIRVMTGLVAIPDGLADHAWLDLEYRGGCLQQDPSGFLGIFGFSQFPGMSFTRAFVREERFCFNDQGFAVVSQLNRLREGMPSRGRPDGAP